LRGAIRLDVAKVGDYGAASFQRTCDHPVICTPSINCTPRRAVFQTELRSGASVRHRRRDARCSSHRASDQPAGDDRLHGKQQRTGRSASSVRTARLHGKQVRSPSPTGLSLLAAKPPLFARPPSARIVR
jgi:hypothetical protein